MQQGQFSTTPPEADLCLVGIERFVTTVNMSAGVESPDLKLGGSWYVVPQDENADNELQSQSSPTDGFTLLVDTECQQQVDSPTSKLTDSSSNPAVAVSEGSTASLSASVPHLPPSKLDSSPQCLSQSHHIERVWSPVVNESEAKRSAAASVALWGTQHTAALESPGIDAAVTVVTDSPTHAPHTPVARGRWWGDAKEPPSPGLAPISPPQIKVDEHQLMPQKETPPMEDDFYDTFWQAAKLLIVLGGTFYLGNRIRQSWRRHV